jgi:hypothetical protein
LDRIAFEREEPMNQVDGCCQHGELLDKYCPECDKEDREAEKKEFNPQEGDKILVSVDRSLLLPRIFLYMDRHGRCACVHSDDEEIYNNGSLLFRVVIWPYAKPLPPKNLLPEERLNRIAQTIWEANINCIGKHGLANEMTQDEISEIWELSKDFV